MSSKELNRLEELKKVHEKRQTTSQAAEILELSTRQVKRPSKQLKTEGVKSLHKKTTESQVPMAAVWVFFF